MKLKSLPASLRTSKDEAKYQEAKQLGLLKPLHDEKVLQEWTHWRLIDNRFPYSMAFSVHHMLIPLRMVAERSGLTSWELMELEEILEAYGRPNYHVMFENYGSRRSINNLFHLHLGVYWENRGAFKL